MIFHLCSVDGRIILDDRPRGIELETVEAYPEYEGDEIYRSAWRVARDYVDESRFEWRPGYGRFEKGVQSQAIPLSTDHGT